MARILNSYLVLWAPNETGIAVDTIKVIDAWSSSKTLAAERQELMANHGRRTQYAVKHGAGKVQVVGSNPWMGARA